MASLNRRMSLDPRWSWHQRSVPRGHMNAAIEILRRPGQGGDYGFDPTTGGLTIPDEHGGRKFPEIILLYRGPGRIANNKDWRARVRTQRGDMGTDQAIRVQAPIRTCPPVYANDLVRAVQPDPGDPELGHLVLGDPELTHYILHVRNPLMSSNAWLRNILCDVDAAHPQSLPPPFSLEPVIAPGDVMGP
ncbi:DUF6093 family protein [Streptomyces sp. NEAU-Y11]|uniref:DUF6093 family protein n=1 Tax=Streptomyces cucumeris TaxID=2962890 RepID=UPI0020C86237|nr:DUF6093 family protein [Streptomyces sp. NEAU-Y11]MCP9209723.1 DUF6093 family protein [Streptomyces sp. NEAU-Y11]